MEEIITKVHKTVHMKNAITWSKESSCKRRQVGSVLVQNDHVIASGYNGGIRGGSNKCEGSDGLTLSHIIHSERNALYDAARRGVSTEGASLFVTFPPCSGCAAALIQAGIKDVYMLPAHFPPQSREMAGLEILKNHKIKIHVVEGIT